MRVKITDLGSAKILVPDGKAQDREGTPRAGRCPQTLAMLSDCLFSSCHTADPNNRKRSFVGTAEYVSPEVLRNEHASAA